MAIEVNDLDIGYRGVTNTTLPQFAGRNRQIVINVDDNYRPIVMDGKTLGGKSKIALIDDVNNITIDKKDLTVTGENAQLLGTGTSGENGLQTRIENKVTDSEASIKFTVRDSLNKTNTLKISTDSLLYNDKELALKEDLDTLGDLAFKDTISVSDLENNLDLGSLI